MRVAAQDPANLSTSQLQERASDHIERNAFSAAVPFLEELDRRLKESEDAAAVRARENILYFLGIGRLQQSDFYGAESALSDFLIAFPNSDQAAPARLYLADTYFYRQRWADARAFYEGMVTQGEVGQLSPDLQLQFWERHSDAVFVEKDWEAGRSVFAQFRASLESGVSASARSDQTAKAASYQLQAAMGLDDFEAVTGFLPEIRAEAGKTRYDLSLNLALLRGGDRLYEVGRFGQALRFYELVLPPAELIGFWEARRDQLGAELERVAGVPWLAELEWQVQADLREATARLQPLGIGDEIKENQVADYGPALTFRIARCYMASDRFYEAFWAFERLERIAVESSDSTAEAFAEEALYGQVKMAAAVRFEERTRRLARRYLRSAEFVNFIGDVGYELLQSTQRTEDSRAVLELTAVFLERLRLDPQLQEAPKLVYLVGATLMEMEATEALREQLGPLLAEYPDRGFSDGLHYWLGLTAVLDGRFPAALEHFENIVTRYPDGGYTEDAHYRIGVAWFGLQQNERAKLQLDGFLQDFPDSPLACEAHALLGDIAASEERWNVALDEYSAARVAGEWLEVPNQAYVDHVVFSGGEILAEQSRWVEMEEWFESYIRRWGRQGRAGDALYQLGRAQIAQGEAEAMLELWIESILEFGNNPNDNGPDLMLKEYAQHFEQARGETPVEVLRNALAIARAQEHRTLELRLVEALRPLVESPDEFPEIEQSDADAASAAVFLSAAQRSLLSDPEIAVEWATQAYERNRWGPFAADALAVLAEAQTVQNNSREAIDAWQALVQRFPDSEHAQRAWLQQGDLQRERGAHQAAIRAYQEVLKVREWRGAAWAEANYKIGLSHFEAGDFEAAFGFCQRVYVLYASVREWAAAAYLISGQALENMNRANDAIATYREFLTDQELSGEPAATEARERLQRLEGVS